ncbi:MAG: hypothetical protein OSJ74_06950 [Clostridia bacterium]|nr:hypothetical protein [Clostridia bacterium]
MNESKMMEKRLKKVLMQDKINAYEGLIKALESDIKLLLGCYMSLCGDVNINIDIVDGSQYQINISAKADNINAPNTI